MINPTSYRKVSRVSGVFGQKEGITGRVDYLLTVGQKPTDGTSRHIALTQTGFRVFMQKI
jgi:hypothetical protein